MKSCFAALAALTAVATVALGCSGGVGNGAIDAEIGVVDAFVPPVDAIRIDAAPEDPPLPPECLAAANRGVAWLVAQQQADGSWLSSAYGLAATAFAVLKLETHASELGLSPFDPAYPYQANVVNGLNWLLQRAVVAPISVQAHGDPDTNANGTGIYFSASSAAMYENSIVLMAIVAGSDPDRIVEAPGAAVGMTYKQVAQEETDYLMWAQSDGTMDMPPVCYRGGWRYQPQNNASDGDNSVSQFAALALDYAEHPNFNFECTIPDWVKLELSQWVACIQNRDGSDNDGGSGYEQAASWPNVYKTGALVQQLAYLQTPASDPAMQAALEFLVRKWNDTSGTYGWKGSPVAHYLGMYSIMKGMESLDMDYLGGIDWYQEFCDVLVMQQNLDGSWPTATYDYDTNRVLSTVWALLILERAAPPPIVIN